MSLATPAPAYLRYPTLCGDSVVFVADDDLWTVPAGGGMARRLTSSRGEVGAAHASPDGKWLAFAGHDEGQPDVYVMPALGGAAERVTYLGSDSKVVGWSRDSREVLFASNYGSPFERLRFFYRVPREGGLPERAQWGAGDKLSRGPGGGVVVARTSPREPAWRKRYRGGTAGTLWIDADDSGEFRPLVELAGNLDAPMWVGERIYFLSDHEGTGNLYSSAIDGGDVQRHTDHETFYARNASTDGKRIVYHAGSDIYLFDPAANSAEKLDVDIRTSRAQRARKFIDASRYLECYRPHPKGHSVALTVRGKPVSMANWEQATCQTGARHGVRYRLATWAADGKRLVVVSDATGEEALEVHDMETGDTRALDAGIELGRVTELEVSPTGDRVAVANHRNQLLAGTLGGPFHVVDESQYRRIEGLAWSPDGKYLAYACGNTAHTTSIKIAVFETRQTHLVTGTEFHDWAPRFDPDGRYLYFLSDRSYNPVYDSLYFELAFPRTAKPYLATLAAKTPNPMVPAPRPLAQEAKKDEPLGEAPTEVHIDFDGLRDRLIAFPVDEGIYGSVWGGRGKALFSTFPVEGSLDQKWWGEEEPPAKGKLVAWEFREHKQTTIAEEITNFQMTADGETIVYRAGNRLRAVSASSTAKTSGEQSDKPGRESGWLDHSRVKISIRPEREWAQMLREAWRLQRDQFWVEDMSGVGWAAMLEKYEPLLERVSTRSELADLVWEMQGELGTSHAYVMGGDHRKPPPYGQGFLGADVEPAPEGGYVIKRIPKGDPWDEQESPPLARAGIELQVGDRIVSVDGVPLGGTMTPQRALAHRAGEPVNIKAVTSSGDERSVCVGTLKSETRLRYRDWVEANRHRVHIATEGRCGYVHIPDMGAWGYAEFHRSYLSESELGGLVVDARFNRGGHVSQLILEKLSRRRVGYDYPRHGLPEPYPSHSVAGPMVCLTNQYAGSDGDIFTHCFKLYGLGPVIGKRTWGGVIGIWPRHGLVDGGITTQPEFSFWFQDVGWDLENHGADVDIDIGLQPGDWAKGNDPQLARGIEEVLSLLEEKPVAVPDPGDRPTRK